MTNRIIDTAEFQTTKDEINVLYTISSKLTQASTPAELLTAASSYAQGDGAIFGKLSSINQENNTLSAELMAEWVAPGGNAIRIGTHFDERDYPCIARWFANAPHPTLIVETATSDLLDENLRAVVQRQQVSSMVALPLSNQGRRVGLIVFSWNKPHHFDERDVRIYTSIIQQAGAVLDSIRLYQQSQERAGRAEKLLAINTALSQATDESTILNAVAQYAAQAGARSLTLHYIEPDVQGKPEEIVNVAVWQNGQLDPAPTALHQRYRLDRYGLSNLWIGQPETPIFLADIEHDASLDAATQGVLLQSNSRAGVLLPLYSSGHWQGIIWISWDAPRSFTDEERSIYQALLQTVAPIVATRRAHIAEAEANRETQLLYRASEALNAATTFAEVAEAVSHLDDFSHGVALVRWENYDFDTATYFEVIATSRHVVERVGKRYAISEFPVARTMPRKGLQYSEDIANDPNVDPVSAASWISQKTYARIGVALSLGNRWMGTLSFHSGVPRQYTSLEKRVVAGIGDLVTAAFERIRLQEQTELARQRAEQRAHELETVATVSAAAASILDKHQLLRTVAELTRSNLSQYHILIYLMAENGTGLSLAAPPEYNHDVSLADAIVLVARAAQTRQAEVINHTHQESHPILPEAKSQIALPMVVGDRLIGVLNVLSPEENRFSPSDVRVMSTLADLIAVAVQNAQLYERAQELAALEERNRLARELHDSVSQALYGIALGTRTAKALLQREPSRIGQPLDYIHSLAEVALAEMRALIFELRPDSLENEGLISALARQASLLQTRHNIQVETEFCEEPNIPIDVKEAVYRVAQEAMHNTFKHAKASRVSLQLQCEDGRLEMHIRDNGVGFDPSQAFPGHLGLRSMRERITRLNGNLTIESQPGAGTHIQVSIAIKG
jgi:signal transduction histidine kinase